MNKMIKGEKVKCIEESKNGQAVVIQEIVEEEQKNPAEPLPIELIRFEDPRFGLKHDPLKQVRTKK